MTGFSKRAAEIYRDYRVDGVSSSGVHQPNKGEIRTHWAVVEAAIPYDTLSMATADLVPATASVLVTRGFAEVGDGGEALYKRVVSEPAHPGKFQSADGAWWELSDRRPNILMFGVKESGTAPDNALALQNAIDFALAKGRSVYIPPGVYFSDPVTISLIDTAGFGWGGRALLYGDGSGMGVIRSTVTGADKAISIIGAYSGASGQANFTLRGFTLSQINLAQAGYGLHIDGVSYLSFEDVVMKGFDRGLNAVDSISNHFLKCGFTQNNRGISAARGSYSNPNAWLLSGCVINGNKNFAIIADAPSNLTIVGGDISLNGTGETTDAAIVINGNPVEGEVGLNMLGTYMEGNFGRADIVINPNNSTAGTHLIQGVGFYRISATDYVTNHFVLDKDSAGETRITVDTCAFAGFNGYTADSGRKAVVVDTEFDTNYVIELRNNRFWSATEKPPVDGVKIIDRTPFLTGDVTTDSAFASTIGLNKVTDSKFRQSAGLSVVGRSANSTGNIADIVAGSDGDILRRSGTAIGFGSAPITSISGLGTGVSTFLQTPSSANLRAALTDETGSGAAVFADAPTLTGTVTIQSGADNDFSVSNSGGYNRVQFAPNMRLTGGAAGDGSFYFDSPNNYVLRGAGGTTLAVIDPLGYLSETIVGIKDGITAPAVTSGYAKIFVDASDGDLKIIFGDGTIKTIVTDT